MTKSQRLCDKQDTLTDETMQQQSSAWQSLRRSTHRGHVRQIRILFADDIARNGQTPLHGGINAKEKTGHSKKMKAALTSL